MRDPLVQLPHLLASEAPVQTLTRQPSLRLGDEHSPLLPGTYALGGRAPDAIALTALQTQPRAAILTVAEDGATVLQRTTASIVVRIDGETVGIGPVELHHGARIDFGTCRVVIETDPSPATPSTIRTGERAAASATTEGARVLTLSGITRGRMGGGQRSSEPAGEQAPNAALVDVGTGARHPLPARRILIGRDDSCDVIVRGNSVSRRHASISPVNGGFLLRDESVNGTLVNGVRVVGTYLLGNGDVVRIHDQDLRVELDASPSPAIRGETTTVLDLSHITRGVTEEQARALANRPIKASLEIVRGSFAGACFEIERAVSSIGRGDENDVRIRDDTVSQTHATLLRKRGAWFVVDLRSMNGTFVDGSRVSGERELHPGARLRVGGVELVFRAIDTDTKAPLESARPGLWARVKAFFSGHDQKS